MGCKPKAAKMGKNKNDTRNNVEQYEVMFYNVERKLSCRYRTSLGSQNFPHTEVAHRRDGGEESLSPACHWWTFTLQTETTLHSLVCHPFPPSV